MANYNRKTELKEVFDFIVRYKTEHDGVGPTVREIMAEFGIHSTNTVVKDLDQMQAAGWIELGPGARAIYVPGAKWTYTEKG